MGNSPLPSREGQGVGLIKAQDAAPSRILQFMFLYVLVPSLTGGVLWLLRAYLPPRGPARGTVASEGLSSPTGGSARGTVASESLSSPTGGSARGLLPHWWLGEEPSSPTVGSARGTVASEGLSSPTGGPARGLLPPLESSPPRGELERGQGARCLTAFPFRRC